MINASLGNNKPPNLSTNRLCKKGGFSRFKGEIRMPRNGSGTYTLPSNGFNPAVSGQAISSTEWNTTAADLVTAISGSLAKDGQTTATARIPFAVGVSSLLGSTAAVAYGFIGDLNTGLYSNAADKFGLVAGGTEIVRVEAGKVAPVADNTIDLGATGERFKDGYFAGNLYVTGSVTGVGSTAWGGTSGGTANALTLTPSPAIASYVTGQAIAFYVNAANTSGAVTVDVSAIGTKDIKKSAGGALVALSVGDLIEDTIAVIQYDGTQFQLINPRAFGKGADVASAATLNLDTATGNLLDVTGTTNITAVTLAEGRQCLTRFTGALTITNGASLVLQGGANYTTAAGDMILWTGYASSVVRGVIFPIGGYARPNQNNTYTKAQRGTPVSLTQAATIAVDLSLGNNFYTTMTGNRTLGQPTNFAAGQSGSIEIIQDGTGSRTLAYHADWLFPGGTDPVLSTAAGATDLLCYQVNQAGTKVFANLLKGFA
jgi:hypothetical protein